LVEYENVAWEELEAAGWRGMHARLARRVNGHEDRVQSSRFKVQSEDARAFQGGFALAGAALGTADDFAGVMMRVSAERWQRANETYQSAHLREIFEEGVRELRGALGGDGGDSGGGRDLTEVLPDPEDFRELAEHFHAGTVDLVSVYDDSLETLAALRRRGIKIGLISNTVWPGELHTRDLRRFGLYEFFDVLTYSSEQPHTKPHPSIFLETLRQLGDVPPDAAVHVGDRIVDDAQGAQAAGMKAVLKWHPRRADVPGIEPDARITTLAELPEALEDLFEDRNADHPLAQVPGG